MELVFNDPKRNGCYDIFIKSLVSVFTELELGNLIDLKNYTTEKTKYFILHPQHAENIMKELRDRTEARYTQIVLKKFRQKIRTFASVKIL